jgi:hypothetical protein
LSSLELKDAKLDGDVVEDLVVLWHGLAEREGEKR